MEIAALLPAYNSGKFIKSVIDRIPRDVVSKIIVVDDGSTDNTYEVALALPDTIVYKHEVNKGYGGAQKTLYEKAYELGFDATVILHADGQHDPEEIRAVVAPILNGDVDVVMGARKQMREGGMPFYKIVGNVGLTFLENIAFGMKLSTFHSGFRACNRKAIEKLDFNRFTNDYHFDSEFLLHSFRAGLRIVEVPVKTIYGDEESGVNVIKYGFNILGLIVSQIFYRIRIGLFGKKGNKTDSEGKVV